MDISKITKGRKGALYFAYGANTNLEAMAWRCPDAEPVGTTTLPNYKLVFRGVADIVPSKGGRVIGALWRITPDCEAALDTFEGFPNLYIKEYGTMTVDGVEEQVMWYVMRNRNYEAMPAQSYETVLRHGYRDFDMPVEQIDKAIESARTYRYPTGRNFNEFYKRYQGE